MKYLHTMVRVCDLDASLRFYCEGLGLREVRRQKVPEGKYTLVFLSAPESPEAEIELTWNWGSQEDYGSARNFGHLAFRVDDIYATCARLQAMLGDIGRELGAAAAERISTVSDDETARALAEQLDALGYEAQAVKRDGEMQVEAYNCVFHALAKAHPDVCRFDLAFMEAATGRSVHHLECLVRGGNACRFRLGAREKRET